MSNQLTQFNHVFSFELKYRLRQPAFYVFSALFFCLTFTATSTDSVQIGGGIGNVARNAPYIIARTINAMGLFTVVLITIFMSTVVSRDKDLGVREILYSTPLQKFPLLMGRFTATTILAVFSASFAALGLLLASLMPYQTPEHIQAFSVLPYLYVIFILVLPNCLMAGALFFSVSILTGRAMATYVAMVAFFALYGFAFAFLGDLQNENLAVLLDPFGLASLDLQTRYWTIIERNTMLPPLTGPFMLTRMLWLAVAGLLLVFTFFRFRMDLGSTKGRASTAAAAGSEKSVQTRGSGALNAAGRVLPALAPTFNFRTSLSQWLSLANLETRTLLRSLPFLVLMLFGLLNLAGNMSSELNGRFLYPVTHRMLSVIAGGFDLFLLIVIVFYSAELVWRDKKHRFHEIQGSLPVPSWIFLTAKFAALTVLILVSLTLAMGLTMGFQLLKGYHHLEPGLYLRGLFVMSFSEWLLLAVIAMFTQVIGRQRYLGFFLMLLYFLVSTFGPEMGIEHHLFFYRSTPAVIYSDMNGYGHFADAALWFKFFWGLLAVIMLTVAARLWPRGSQDSLWPAQHEHPERLQAQRRQRACAGQLRKSIQGLSGESVTPGDGRGRRSRFLSRAATRGHTRHIRSGQQDRSIHHRAVPEHQSAAGAQIAEPRQRPDVDRPDAVGSGDRLPGLPPDRSGRPGADREAELRSGRGHRRFREQRCQSGDRGQRQFHRQPELFSQTRLFVRSGVDRPDGPPQTGPGSGVVHALAG